MSNLPWFSGETPPAPRRRVRVQWAGREFLAYCDYVNGLPAWYVLVNAERVDVPTKKDRKSWGMEPDCWQPEDGMKWTDPLPEPIVSSTPRMVNVRARRRVHGDQDRYASDHEPEEQWWLNPHAISYSRRGDVSLEEAEGRVMRAILTDGITQGRTGGDSQTAQALQEISPEEALDLIEKQYARNDLAARFEPGPRDHTDAETAMKWFAALNPVELRHKKRTAFALNQSQKVLIWRAVNPPYSWADISRHLGVSAPLVRQRHYPGAIEKVWRAANGMKVFKHVTVIDQVALTKEQNRAAKRLSR